MCTTVSGDLRAFIWRAGVMSQLAGLSGRNAIASDINARGQVVGAMGVEAGVQHAFLWQAGSVTDLGTRGGASSDAVGVNARGEVVGESDLAGGTHSFLWHP